MKTTPTLTIEELQDREGLEQAAEKAWAKYRKLQDPADRAYKEYEILKAKSDWAVLYVKAKKAVLRDLIAAAALPEAPKQPTTKTQEPKVCQTSET